VPGTYCWKEDQKRKQYYVYVLEASLAFHNGMTIPLMSEFLSYTEGDTERKKQDCETKAFKRLANRLKSSFKRLPIILPDKGKIRSVHVVVCKEKWEEVDNKSNEIVTRESKHAWISSKPLNNYNIHDRCNLAACHRWNIESEILIQKHHGYQYEHCFSYNWNAMKGYHYLMRIGLMLNVLVQYSECFIEVLKALGKRGTIKFVFETLKGHGWMLIM